MGTAEGHRRDARATGRPTLEHTFSAIPKDGVDEVILVDDPSTDDTVRLARELPLHLVWHPTRPATAATRRPATWRRSSATPDVVVMLHPDGQYEPELIPSMVEPIVPARPTSCWAPACWFRAALAAGMPRWKYVANRVLTDVENRIMGTHLSEAHTGYRAYSRDCCSPSRSCATRSTSPSIRSC